MRFAKILFILFFLLGSVNSQPVQQEQIRINKITNDTLRVKERNKLAQQLWSSDPSQAIAIFNASLNDLKLSPNEKLEASTLVYIGFAYSNTPKKDSARHFYKKALILQKKIDNKKGIAQSLNSLGSLEIMTGNYDSAAQYVMNALEVAGQIKDSVNISKSYNSLGILYENQNMLNKAIVYYSKSLKIKKALEDKRGQAMTLNNLANISKTTMQYDSSLKYYNDAVNLLKEMNDMQALAMVYGNIGGVYVYKKQYNDAIRYYKKAHDMYSQTEDLYGKATALYNLGCIYQSQKNHETALEYIKQSEQIASSINVKILLKDIYQAYASTYSDQGEFKKAYEYMNLYNGIKDSLQNENNARMVGELNSRYESVQKEKAIEILNKDKALNIAKIKEQKRFQLFLFLVIGLCFLSGFALLKGYINKKRSNKLLEKQKEEINMQKELLEEKNKDITDSINYAQRLQKSILPSSTFLKKLLPEHFVFYRPKDIVSGDFYWASEKDNKILFAVADCTGHGVPGAFMSVLGSNLLNEIVNEKKVSQPNLILDLLRENIIRTLNSEGAEYESKDGMDISLISLDKLTGEMRISNANNPVWIIRNEELHEIKADKFPVGVTYDHILTPFTEKAFHTQKGDLIYLFSDGYADQFGGSEGKKFKYKKLKNLLTSLAHLPVSEQKQQLEFTFDNWKGALQQVDDVLLTGIKIS